MAKQQQQPGGSAAGGVVPSNPAPTPSVGYEITFKHVLNSDQQVGTYSLSVECSAFKDGKAVSNQIVIVKEGISEKYSAPTDINGIMVYNANGILGKAEDKILRFCLAGLPFEKTFLVSIPERNQTSTADNDPESLLLYPSDDGAGRFSVLVRVLKTKGVGLKTTVNILYRGSKHPVQTDDSGDGVFVLPDILNPGESFPLLATVDGIKDEARIKISRPRNIVRPARFSRAWFEINNGRAFVLSVFTVMLWLFCFSIGPGELILNKMTFRNESSGLSSQEEIYNRSVSQYNKVANPNDLDKAGFAAQKHEDTKWQHKYLLLALFATFFTIIYAILSQREEIAEGIKEGAERIFSQSSVKASDPTYEKLAKWAGIYSIVRNPKVEVAMSSSSGATAASSGGQHSLATFFSMDLLSDFIMEVLPAILKRIF
jgi:hypothetical protein